MQQIFQAGPKTRDNLQIDFQIIPFSLMNTNNESRHQRVRVKKNRGTHNGCLDSINSLLPSRTALQSAATDIGTILNTLELDELTCFIGAVASLFERIAQGNYI